MPLRRITRSVAVLALATISSVVSFVVSSSSASTPAMPANTSSLFAGNRSLKLDTGGAGPMMVATGDNSVFVVGTFDHAKGVVADLIRIDLGTWRIAAAARFPNETSVAFGDGSLWWATGQNAFDVPASDSGRALLKINPANLLRESTFLLPVPTVLVTVAGKYLWVATPTMLYRLDPESGRILVKIPLSFTPTEMSASGQGKYVVVLGAIGSKQFVSDYYAASGRRIVERLVPGGSGVPLTSTARGVWIASEDVNNKAVTARYYGVGRLVLTAARGGYPVGTSLFPGAGVIWSVGSGGEGTTECLDMSTGQVLARGGPLGVWGSFATNAGRTYLLFERDLTDFFARVTPSKRCI